MDDLTANYEDTTGTIKFGIEGGLKFNLYYRTPLSEDGHDHDDRRRDETTLDETELSRRQLSDDIVNTEKHVLNLINGTRRLISGENPKKLTDYVQKLMEILTEFNNTDLKYFLRTVKSELEKYKSKDSHHFSTFLVNRVNKAKNTPSDILRKQMTSIYEKIEEEKFDQHDKKVIEHMNSLYVTNYTNKIEKFLDDIKNYRLKGAKDVNLNKTVQNIVRSIIFDQYKKIKRNDREAFITKISEYWFCLSKSSNRIIFKKKIERPLNTTTQWTYAIQWSKPRIVNRRIKFIPHRLFSNLKKNLTRNRKDQPKKSKTQTRENKVFVERERVSIYRRASTYRKK